MTIIELEINGTVTYTEEVGDAFLKSKLEMYKRLGQASGEPYAVFYRKTAKMGLAAPKISQHQIQSIIKLIGPKSYDEVSKEIGVSVATISKILNRIRP